MGQTLVTRLANPDLLPEQQRGIEAGMELYVGSRGSLVITRYNQTVDDLILIAAADSVDLVPALRTAYGCAEWQCAAKEYQNLDLGAVRNEGWETQATLTFGPFRTRECWQQV